LAILSSSTAAAPEAPEDVRTVPAEKDWLDAKPADRAGLDALDSDAAASVIEAES
jgi:hypothetical protein